ncbi:MAG TPA: hypothetical protein VGK48_15910 [Terriglobia bacterium]|jgi:hypothetical protein
MKKKQALTFVFFCGIFLLLVMIANSFVPVPVSKEQAIMTYLQENFGDSKTAWLDTIDSIQTAGTTVVVTTRKSRHNDAIEICEAVSMFIYVPTTSKQALTDIQVQSSGKVIARRSGVNDHCG